MTRPHEEKWETGEGVLSGALYANGIWIGSFTNPLRARLAKGAPALARGLLQVVSRCAGCAGTGIVSVRAPHGYDTTSCPSCEEDRAALRAAGVAP